MRSRLVIYLRARCTSGTQALTNHPYLNRHSQGYAKRFWKQRMKRLIKGKGPSFGQAVKLCVFLYHMCVLKALRLVIHVVSYMKPYKFRFYYILYIIISCSRVIFTSSAQKVWNWYWCNRNIERKNWAKAITSYQGR